MFAALPADENAAARRRRSGPRRRRDRDQKFGLLEYARRAERAIPESETVAAPNNPLGQSVHFNDKTVGVDDNDAGGELVKRARRDGRFPSQLPEPQLNLGRSAKRL